MTVETKEEKKQRRQKNFNFLLKVGLILVGIGGILCLIGFLINSFPLIIIGIAFVGVGAIIDFINYGPI
ncbi:MAG: hypothetical protein ACFE78_10080 [Candidatus Hodarchaeota archaeon]